MFHCSVGDDGSSLLILVFKEAFNVFLLKSFPDPKLEVLDLGALFDPRDSVLRLTEL